MELFVSLRYLRGRKMGFVSLITNISILGVILGTMVLIAALSISNGFHAEVKSKIVGTMPHGQIRRFFYRPIMKYDSLARIVAADRRVAAVSPAIEGKSVIEYRNAKYDVPPIQDGVKVFAVVDSLESQVTDIDSAVVRGEWRLDSTVSYRDRKNPSIVIGKGLAKNFGVGLKDEVILMSSTGETAMGSITPKMVRFTVAGIFSTGMYEYDRLFTYISLEAGQKLYNMEGVQLINFRCTNINDATAAAQDINERLGHEFKHNDWESRNRSLFQWMKVEKRVILIVISLIMVVAAFNIASSLIMMIMEKRREIGILRSMGATRGAIIRIFLFNGGIIGLIGSTVGTVFGVALCLLQQRYEWITLPGDVYFVNVLPVLIKPADVVAIYIAANALCLLASLYPAMQASKMIPAQAMRID
ncbi:MAG: FtsX-like permease family protein [Fibrobacterota bacterium]